jgi:hypothetical protein
MEFIIYRRGEESGNVNLHSVADIIYQWIMQYDIVTSAKWIISFIVKVVVKGQLLLFYYEIEHYDRSFGIGIYYFLLPLRIGNLYKVMRKYFFNTFLVRPSFIITIGIKRYKGGTIYQIKGISTRNTKMVVQILSSKPKSQKTKKTGFGGIFLTQMSSDLEICRDDLWTQSEKVSKT